MSRPATKTDLIAAAVDRFEKLNRTIGGMTEKELTTPFDFSADANKKEAHWQRDKNLRDVLIHLYEWHRLLLTWVQSNEKGEAKPFIPEPYNWRTYGEMNVEFWRNHQSTPLETAKELLSASHQDVLAAAEKFTNEELFSKCVFPWVGGSPLGSYFVSATSSHYDWAIKKLKAHKQKAAA